MSKVIITDQKKEEIKSAADIVDIVSDYVKLKRSGNNFTGLCPFHNEKTPSFYVTPSMGIYKCFGCGSGGDVFNFLMEIEGVGFVEAMRTLAERYHIELPEEENPEYDERSQLTEGIYHALRFAGRFFFQQLTAEDAGKEALKYIQKRGIKADTIKKFGLGFSPDMMTGLLQHAKSAGINELYLAEAGLIKYNDNDIPYDVFRGRLMFPIFSTSGKVIGFGGRVMQDGKGPKYINSPQTKVYSKSEVMYGINFAKNEIRKHKQAILVEGYMDVISLHQNGIKNVLATSGTSVTKEQMRLLKNYTDDLLMVYDADNAGQNAMMRGLDIALEAGLQVRLMHLPDGEDPDSYVQKYGNESFREFVRTESQDFITFMVEHAKQAGEWDDPLQRKNNITRILTSIGRVPDAVLRETLVDHLRKLSSVGGRALYEELGGILANRRRDEVRTRQREERRAELDVDKSTEPNNRSQKIPKKPKTKPGYEKDIIRLMLEFGDPLVAYIGSNVGPDHFQDDELKTFFERIIELYNNEKEINASVFLEKDPPYPELVSEIMMDRFAVSEYGNEKRTTKIVKDSNPYFTAKGAMKLLMIRYLRNMRDKLAEELHLASDNEKSSLLAELQEARMLLHRFETTSSIDLFPSENDE